MGELPIIVEGNIDDSDEELIAQVNTLLSQLPMTEVIGLRLRKKSGHDGHID